MMICFFLLDVPGCDFYAHLEMVDTEAWIKYGAPRDMWVRYIIRNPKVQQGPGMQINLSPFTLLELSMHAIGQL